MHIHNFGLLAIGVNWTQLRIRWVMFDLLRIMLLASVKGFSNLVTALTSSLL